MLLCERCCCCCLLAGSEEEKLIDLPYEIDNCRRCRCKTDDTPVRLDEYGFWRCDVQLFASEGWWLVVGKGESEVKSDVFTPARMLGSDSGTGPLPGPSESWSEEHGASAARPSSLLFCAPESSLPHHSPTATSPATLSLTNTLSLNQHSWTLASPTMANANGKAKSLEDMLKESKRPWQTRACRRRC